MEGKIKIKNHIHINIGYETAARLEKHLNEEYNGVQVIPSHFVVSAINEKIDAHEWRKKNQK